MRRTLRNCAVPALGLAAVLLSGAAHADPTYTLSLTGNYSLDLTGNLTHNLVTEGPDYIGVLQMKVAPGNSYTTGTSAGGTQYVYCTDIFNNFNAGTYTLQSGSLYTELMAGPYNYSSTIAAAKVNQIDALLNHTNPNSALTSGAVQAAIWEIENEPGTSGYNVQSGNLQSGSFYITNASDTNLYATANGYLLNVTGEGLNWQPVIGSTVFEYVPYPTGPANQSFGFISSSGGGNNTPVPEPSAFSLFGLSILGLAMIHLGLKPRRWI